MNPFILTLIALFLSGTAHAIQDIIRNRYAFSIFARIKNEKLRQWIDPTVSWKNKWKNGDPGQGPRFLFASTLFVWTTDLWHFAQMIRSSSLVISVVLWFSPSLWLDLASIFGLGGLDVPLWLTYVLDFSLLKLASGFAFTLFYDYILSTKKISMSYSIWKFLVNAGLVAGKNTGLVIAAIYLSILTSVVGIAYRIAPGPPQWKEVDAVPVWEWIMVIGFVAWIGWSAWMLFAGSDKMDARHKAELESKS